MRKIEISESATFAEIELFNMRSTCIFFSYLSKNRLNYCKKLPVVRTFNTEREREKRLFREHFPVLYTIKTWRHHNHLENDINTHFDIKRGCWRPLKLSRIVNWCQFSWWRHMSTVLKYVRKLRKSIQKIPSSAFRTFSSCRNCGVHLLELSLHAPVHSPWPQLRRKPTR